MATVFTGGTIIVNPAEQGHASTTHALAMSDGRVTALGEEALALKAATGATEIDLQGGTLAPAVGDGHCHPILGALEDNGPAVREATDLQGILDAVATYKSEHPEAAWIIGASYDATFTSGGLFDARWLDKVTGNTPTVLRAWDYHTIWVNSAALAAAHITADTPDPDLGRIMRRDDGTPLGTLQESAANNFLSEIVPPRSLEERVAAIERATLQYAAQGTTWIQDAWVDHDDVEIYLQAAREDRLHTRVNLAFRADPHTWREQLPLFARQRETVQALGHPRLTADTIKFFLDGVIESRTAALLEPYTDAPSELGLPNWTDETLRTATAIVDAEGFQLHLHAIGDAANRSALDAIQEIVESGVDADHERRPVIAHVAMLHPDDVARFAELGVIANFEPFWAQCDAVMQSLTIPHIGESREDRQYRIGSLTRAGAHISFGSDWPVTTKDWRQAMSVAITRRSHEEPEVDSWLPAERVTAEDAYNAYARGNAFQAGADDRGTLAVGMTADLVWLSTNPLEGDPADIPSIEVLGTWLAGTETFSKTS